jgi:hypothetical protein
MGNSRNMKKIIAIVFSIIMFSCNDADVTKVEINAVQSVLNFYGGICNRSKGFETENTKTLTYFELEMSKSKLISSYSKMPELPASNIAYLFYSNLENEKDKYSFIRVKTNFSEKHSATFDYNAKELIEIETLVKIFKNVASDIKQKKYSHLYSRFEVDSSSVLTAQMIESYCATDDSAYGGISKYQFQGFSFLEPDKESNPEVHLGGILVRKKTNIPLSVFIDRKTTKVNSIRFQF